MTNGYKVTLETPTVGDALLTVTRVSGTDCDEFTLVYVSDHWHPRLGNRLWLHPDSVIPSWLEPVPCSICVMPQDG